MIKFGGKSPLFASLGGYKKIPQTFTRASDAYLNGVLYGPNTPRFPSNSGTKGALVEESATNLAQYSHELDNAYWTASNVTVTANAATAPDGTLTADKIIPSTGNLTHSLSRAAVLTTAQPGTVSGYFKANGYDWVAIGAATGSRGYFNLATGTLGTINAGFTGRIDPVGNGWYRCSLSHASLASGSAIYIVTNADNTASFAGDGTSGVLAWGFQPEQKAYPTTYVPTSGATATRAAETLTVPTAGLLVPSAGSVKLRVWVDGELASSAPALTHNLFGLADATATNLYWIRKQSGNNNWQMTFGGGGTWTQQLSVGWHTFVLAWDSARVSLYVDGIERAFFNSPTLPASLHPTMYIGSGHGGAFTTNQPTAWLATYTRKLSGAEIAANVTSPVADFTAYLDYTHGTLGNLTFNTNPTYDPDLFESRDVNGIVFG